MTARKFLDFRLFMEKTEKTKDKERPKAHPSGLKIVLSLGLLIHFENFFVFCFFGTLPATSTNPHIRFCFHSSRYASPGLSFFFSNNDG